MSTRLLAGTCALLLLAANGHAARLYNIRIKTNPPGAVVYVESREAGVRGTTPHRLRLPQGPCKVIIEAPGHEPLETVIDVRRSDTFTFTLSKERPKVRLRLVTVDPEAASGSHVLIDGKASGSLPASFLIEAGSHLIAVHKPGYALWQQWVELKDGEQRTLSVALAPEGPKTGALLIASHTPGAKLFVDGKPVGDSPALIQQIPAGKHTVELRAEDRAPKSKTVEVLADQTNKVLIDYEVKASQTPVTGTLRILTEQEGVDVYVDGEFRGKAPVTVTRLPEGTHIATGKLAGYTKAEEVVEVSGNRVQTIRLTLERVAPPPAPAPAATASAAPASQPAQAATLQAPTSAPSSHETLERAVDPDDDPEIIRGLSSYGAQLVPPGYFTADISPGFPHLAEGRLTTGIHSWEFIALDAGIELRSYGTFTEFDAISKVRLLFRDPLALAAFVALGGGGGPNGRNTFFMNTGLTVSLMFKKILTFTGRIYANVYTDRHCPSDPGGDERAVCGEVEVDGQSPRDRYSGARLMLTGMLELPITTHIGAFLLIEGAPFQSQRMAFTDAFSALMPGSDPRVYGRLGVTFKF